MLEVHISKHSLFRLKITVGCLVNTYPSIHKNSQDHGRLSEVLWCVVCCVLCGCMRVLCCVMSCVLCDELCCVVVVLCGVWCVCFFLFLYFSLFLSFSPSLSLNSLLSLSRSLSFFLVLSFFCLVFLFLFSLLPLSLFSSLHQTLWKEPINQHGGQHRGM